ncbi:MAG TPA: hypothetical protein PKO36_03725 [Candidatus Hydrogenedentes bacterium]|nr:hypothetical protein [Candidatus Hydrogenedentota bacterium]HOV74898.1 hypothetical protein [Candidatus Hydrogenedentota bacterium]HPC17540.1 hypothetical protein [Candidatus Hydrogenedentota bacterium]HRT20619.1 hypothetical protein [Candidatus Hydrogenedentota bacterium]HRT65374.1 hypothetical protein [Candidatus Hydrogenedentota bacterium]
MDTTFPSWQSLIKPQSIAGEYPIMSGRLSRFNNNRRIVISADGVYSTIPDWQADAKQRDACGHVPLPNFKYFLFMFERTEFLRQRDENFLEDWHFRAIPCRIGQRDLVLKLKMAAW